MTVAADTNVIAADVKSPASGTTIDQKLTSVLFVGPILFCRSFVFRIWIMEIENFTKIQGGGK